MAKVFIGNIINTKSLNEFIVIPRGFIAVSSSGKIIAVGDDFATCQTKNQAQLGEFTEVHLEAHQFIMPGFIDCHIHAPQVAQIGLGLDMPLLDWLNAYTFPLEAKYNDTDFAKRVYKKVVRATIAAGTTLASYFGTNSKDSTVILAKEAMRRGQRALVGKVCSDCNSPDFYVDTAKESIADTKTFVHDIQNLRSPLILPTITPRFAVSCTKNLLAELGKIAKTNDLHIQTHISEAVDETNFVKSLFGKSYAQVYDNAGLLTNKTILAHGVHLEDEELSLLRERGTAIAHCPASNTMLSSGFCDIKRLLKNGVKVGLGTDVSGGNSISILNTILRTLDVSHHLEFVKKQDIKGTGKCHQQDVNYTPLNYKQAIYLATLGGAEALAMDTITGNFVEGKDFDALLVDTHVFPLQDYESDDLAKNDDMRVLELVQRFVYVGDDRNILKVFVAGREIKAEN